MHFQCMQWFWVGKYADTWLAPNKINNEREKL